MNLDCILCGTAGPQVRPRMVEWSEPLSKRWEVIPACYDVASCRQRVEQMGDVWPLVPTRNEREALRADARDTLGRLVNETDAA